MESHALGQGPVLPVCICQSSCGKTPMCDCVGTTKPRWPCSILPSEIWAGKKGQAFRCFGRWLFCSRLFLGSAFWGRRLRKLSDNLSVPLFLSLEACFYLLHKSVTTAAKSCSGRGHRNVRSCKAMERTVCLPQLLISLPAVLSGVTFLIPVLAASWKQQEASPVLHPSSCLGRGAEQQQHQRRSR